MRAARELRAQLHRQERDFVIKICRMRLGAGRCPLVRSKRRVALNQFHAIEGYAKLFRDQLLLRGIQPLAQFTFPGVRRHTAVAADSYPRIEPATTRTIEALGVCRTGCHQSSRQSRHAEADNQSTGPSDELPPRDSGFLER